MGLEGRKKENIHTGTDISITEIRKHHHIRTHAHTHTDNIYTNTSTYRVTLQRNNKKKGKKTKRHT